MSLPALFCRLASITGPSVLFWHSFGVVARGASPEVLWYHLKRLLCRWLSAIQQRPVQRLYLFYALGAEVPWGYNGCGVVLGHAE